MHEYNYFANDLMYISVCIKRPMKMCKFDWIAHYWVALTKVLLPCY